jgi:2-polyprenyl-6-methoxyphenol hydroxylase-like FAD-dependent oxidoreductase
VQRIVIVGAGIGGLCAARAVALAGHEPVVLERSPAGTAIGAGLLLWPDAVHALDALGQGSAVRAVAAPALHTVFRDAAGRTLSEVNVEMLGSRAGAPMWSLSDRDLHELLAEGSTVRYDVAVSAADDRGVTLADGEQVDGDAVIGTDGIGSVVREHVCPGARPLDSGYTVIRGIAAHDIGRGEAFEAWAAARSLAGRRCRPPAPTGSTRPRAHSWTGRTRSLQSAPSNGRHLCPLSSPPPLPRACSSTASCAWARCLRGRGERWRYSVTPLIGQPRPGRGPDHRGRRGAARRIRRVR